MSLKITYNWKIPVKIELGDKVLYELDMSPPSYWEVSWAFGWGGEYESKDAAEQECLHVCGYIRTVREVKPDDSNYKDPRVLNITKQVYNISGGDAIVPIVLNDSMKEVLTEMLTNCHSIEESYSDLLEAASLTKKD